jgi:hypothetical protein
MMMVFVRLLHQYFFRHNDDGICKITSPVFFQENAGEVILQIPSSL